MAEQNDVSIRISAQNDATPAFQAIAQALTQLGQQFQQTTVFMAQMATALQQVQQASSANATGASAMSQATRDQAHAIREQTQAYREAEAATLKFRQDQAAAAQAAREAARETRAAAQEARAAGDMWRQALSVAGGLGIVTGIQQLVAAIKNATVGAVEAAISYQSLVASFTALTRSAEGAQRALAFVRGEAGRVGIDFKGAAESFKGLEAAARGTTLEGQKIRDIFTAVATASRVMGLSADATKHVLIAVEQSITKGVVSAEELRRQMGNFLPGNFEISARAIEKTTAALNDMIKSGELLSEDFWPKWAKQLQKELGPGLENAAKTAAATFARLGNEVQALAVEVGNSILKYLQPIADFVAKTLEQIRKAREGGQGKVEAGLSAQLQMSGLPQESLSQEQRSRLLTLEREKQAQYALNPSIEDKVRSFGRMFKGRTVEQELDDYIDLIKKEQEAGKIARDAQAGEEKLFDVEPRGQAFLALTKQIIDLHKTWPKIIEDANAKTKTFPETFEPIKTQLKAAVDFNEELFKKIMSQRDFYRNMPPEIQKIVKEHQQIERSLQRQIEAQKEGEQAAARAEREREQAAKRAEADARHAAEGVEKSRVRTREQQDAELAVLDKMRDKYTKIKEVRDSEYAERMKIRYADRPEVVAIAEIVQTYAELNEEAVEGVAIIKARTKALIEADEAEDAYFKKLRDTLEQLRAPKEDVLAVKLRQQGGVVSPEREQEAKDLRADVEAAQLARKAEDRLKHMYTTIGQSLEGAFNSLWDQIFTIGEKRSEQFGLTVLRIFQTLARQLSTELLHSMLSSLVPPDKEGLPAWAQAVKAFAGFATKVASSYFGGGTGAGGGMGSGGVGGGGGGFYAIEPPSMAAGGGYFPRGLGTIQAFAGGGVIRQPGFAILGENAPGTPEAVVPMPSGRIPVAFTNGGPANDQPIIIQLNQDFSGSIDPRALRTSPKEIIGVIARDISQDGVVRRVIVQQAR